MTLERLKPARNKMVFLPRLSAVLLVIVCVVMSVSDGASVPISYDDDLESLAASKILQDRTSPSSFSSSSSATSTLAQPRLQELVASTRRDLLQMKNKSKPSLSSDGGGDDHDSAYLSRKKQASYELSSPLHVAQCRATCLQKLGWDSGKASGSNTGTPAASPVLGSSSTDIPADDLHLLPLLRSRRKRGLEAFQKKLQSSPDWNCEEDCFTCWESCELLQAGNAGKKKELKKTIFSSEFPSEEQGVRNEAGLGGNIAASPAKEGKQSILACSSPSQAKQCAGGCQVACSFYEQLFKGKVENTVVTEKTKTFTSDPVVATSQESVVRVIPGKITWPAKSIVAEGTGPATRATVPLVYVVIQEYPDGKWRQIAQTSGAEVEIPRELTSAMKTKLRSVRVLVVGPQGLMSVLSPEQRVVPTDDNQKNDFAEAVGMDRKTTSTKTTSTDDVTPEPTQNSGILLSSADDHDDAKTSSFPTNDQLEATSSTADFSSGAKNRVESHQENELNVMVGFRTPQNEDPFHLRRVSLIHQKSLVIAELRWDQIGSNPSQEYLITWELTGGGLKGHLVTDSTSVTLSLWPDTLYRIQVELFEQNLDSDGEQPETPAKSSSSLKSLALTVDTSEASFPMESPSALLSNSREDDDELAEGEEDSESEGSERVGDDEEEEDPAHKSVSGFRNMTLLLGISVVATLLVLCLIALAAFAWTRLALNFESGGNNKARRCGGGCCHFVRRGGGGCWNGCFSSSTREPALLLSQDDLLDDNDSRNTSPLYYGVALKSTKHHFSLGTSHHKKTGQACSSAPITVAVISRASPSSSGSSPSSLCSLQSYSNNNGGSSPFSLSSAGKAAVVKRGEQGCPSSCYRLPTATCAPISPLSSSPPVTTESSTTRSPQQSRSIQQLPGYLRRSNCYPSY